ncbi:MAG: DUF2341 domain-containing protein [Hadesarchaea archaeon]|nr:DUF2341 domain-containing protein [Hadesarchaea archaeon]
MKEERGFAIMAAALLIAMSFFFSLGAVVVVEHSRLVEKSTRSQQLQALRLREDLKITKTENGLEIFNKGILPSTIVAVVEEQNGSLVYHDIDTFFVEASEKKAIFGSEFMSEAWWNENWSNKTTVTVFAGANGMPGDYTVKIWENSGYCAVKWRPGMKPDFSDLRYVWENTDGFFVCSYWIENYIPGENAIVWVRLPADVTLGANASTTNLKQYYGNPYATSQSSADAAFLLYDDFLGTSLDTTKWQAFTCGVSGTNSVTVSNGILSLRSGPSSSGSSTEQNVVSINSFSCSNTILTARINNPNWGGTGSSGWYRYAGWGLRTRVSGGSWSNYGALLGSGESGHILGHNSSADTTWTSSGNKSGSDAPNTWAIRSIVNTGSKIRWFKDGTLVYESTSDIPNTTEKVSFNTAHWHTSLYYPQGSLDVDWVILRKYVDPEPTTSVGSERTKPPDRLGIVTQLGNVFWVQ